MKHFISALFMLALMVGFSCLPNDKTVAESVVAADTTSVKWTAKNLVGKTIEYRYGEDIYHVTLDTDSTMHWEAIAGAEKGIKENETYFMEAIGDNKMFITWDEANGIAVAQVLDLDKGIVFNHLMIDRKLRNGTGEIAVLEK